MDTNKEYSFIAACKDFFGNLPEQTNMQFAAEVKALTDDDRAEIKAGLMAQGYKVI